MAAANVGFATSLTLLPRSKVTGMLFAMKSAECNHVLIIRCGLVLRNGRHLEGQNVSVICRSRCDACSRCSRSSHARPDIWNDRT